MIVEAVRAYDLVKTLNLGPYYRGSVCLLATIDNGYILKICYAKHGTQTVDVSYASGQIDFFLQKSCNSLPVYNMKCRLL